MLKLLTFPFRVVWLFIGMIFGLLGRMLSLLIGITVMIVGLILTVTLIGAFAGIPLIILGALLMTRSFF